MLKTFVATPTTDQLVIKRFKRQLQWLLFLRVVFLTLLLGVNLLLQSTEGKIIIPPYSHIVVFVVFLYLYSVASVLLLGKISRYSTFSYLQVLIDTLLVTCLVYFSGGSQSVFAILYFFPIIAGSFILQRRGGLAVAAASTIFYGFVLGLESFGIYPPFFDQFWYNPISDLLVAMNFFSIYGLTFFLVAVLSFLLAERLYRTEEALSKTTLKYDRLSTLYKQIFDDIDTGIITIDSREKISSFNRASERITGFTAIEVLGRKLAELLPEIRLERGEKWRSVIELGKKNGERVPVACTISELHLPTGADDSQVLTLQNLSEIRQMEAQIRQAEKMAAIGEMAAKVAHEFRNPLTAISGSAQVLADGIEMKPAFKGLMEIILRECGRLEASIGDFLEFSKPAMPEKEWLPVSSLIEEAVTLLKQTPDWPFNCQLTVDLPKNMDCWGDPQQLHHMTLNVIHNACLAVQGRENAEIQIRASEAGEEEGREVTVLSFIDNGGGIAPDIIDRIFDPFFTTRENGTGLGLTIVHQIVDAHGGTIKVNSRSGSGATFEISLPLP